MDFLRSVIYFGVCMGVVSVCGMTEKTCAEIEDCSDCDNPGIVCTACSTGLSLSDDNMTCSWKPEVSDNVCSEQCTSCNMTGSCTQCLKGYFLDQSKKCERCDGQCSQCMYLGVAPVCQQCSPGYHLLTNDLQCKACPANCLHCADGSTCTSCRTGFYVHTDGGCMECPGGFQKCLSCHNANKCDACQSGLYFDGSACISCINNCDICPDADLCNKCEHGYFLSADRRECITAEFCQDDMYRDYEGCSGCLTGYIKGLLNTCYTCPKLNSQKTCSKCMTNTMGHFYNEASQSCMLCPENCLSCDSAVTCNNCSQDMVWDESSEICISCEMAMMNNYTLTEDQCAMCSNVYFNGSCLTCIEYENNTVEIDSKERCEGCSNGEKYQGQFWAQGICRAVDCSNLTNQDECELCKGKVWYNETSLCKDRNCTDIAGLNDEDSCLSCSNNDSVKGWSAPSCNYVNCLNSEFTSESVCNTCDGRIWDEEAATCKAVSCRSTGLLNSKDKCEACSLSDGPFRYWNSDLDQCSEIDCINGILDTEEKCYGCRFKEKYWDSNNRCSVASCADPKTKAECEACKGKIWIASGKCLGSTAICKGKFTDEKERCLHCPGQYWDGQTCIPVASSASNNLNGYDKQSCEAFPRHYWNERVGGCNYIGTECSSAVLDTIEKCRSCKHKGYAWDHDKASCSLFELCEGGADTEEKCSTCIGSRYWGNGYCNEVDCKISIAQMGELECMSCQGNEWIENEVGGGTCRKLNCDNVMTLITKTKCLSCKKIGSSVYWDGVECKSLEIDCEVDLVADQTMCSACHNAENPKFWDVGKGMCHMCPLNCLKCDHDGCLQCKEGNAWDGIQCVACLGSSLSDEDMCTGCPGRFWKSGAIQCGHCPTHCQTCKNEFVCDVCEPGMVWDGQMQACTSCILKTQEECSTCSDISRGKYFNITSDSCIDCSIGCTKCDSNKCIGCSGNYYLSSGSCLSCDQVALDSQITCQTCAKKVFWDTNLNQCKGCMSHCEQCSSSKSCSECSIGFFFDTLSNTCKSCPTACLKCSSGGSCTKCTSNFFFNDSNKVCNQCPNQCSECVNPDGCVKCRGGYFLHEMECKPCMLGCSVCTTESDCLQCESGHCWDAKAKACFQSEEKCSNCVKKDSDRSISCLSCASNHFLEVCKPCSDPGCKNCSKSISECSKCKDGYYLIASENRCEVCPGSPNCLYCSNNQLCRTCKDGYYYDEDQNMCLACASGCTLCSKKNECSQCQDSNMYWDTTTLTCKSCLSGCVTCSRGLSCDRCQEGKFYNNTTKSCDQCLENCQKCNKGESCDICLKGFYGNEKLCQACVSVIENCQSCMTDGKDVHCLTCDIGYTLKDGADACIPCGISGCELCIDPEPFCNECDKGYQPTFPTKRQCFPGCYTCKDNDECVNPTDLSNLAACPGLGTYASCWTHRNDYDAGAIEYTRGCFNDTCDDDHKSEYCRQIKTASGGMHKRCSVCCQTMNCNSKPLAGSNGSEGNLHKVKFIFIQIYMLHIMTRVMVNCLF